MSIGGTWKTRLLDCCDDPKAFAVALFCLPCQLAYHQAGMHNEEPDVLLFAKTCLCPLCCGVLIRGEIREKYGYTGTFLSDVLEIFFCPMCAVSQQSRELKLNGMPNAVMCMTEEEDLDTTDTEPLLP
mmetsp:Transcript_34721/g.97910  ORF Transcript_34721/g.97910 Transcript_34721/m.97910 type:complete len:128 (+) Transcript_34721:81-464(+)